ncbi:MgtC/SapB family protein [Streptomyces sp. NPDC004009]
MHALTTMDFLIRLATGAACGALIGVERQWRARRAGLRTNALVAIGATLFVLYGVAVGDAGSGDVAGALEQVITRLSLEPGVHDLHWHVDDEDEKERAPRAGQRVLA